MEAGGAEGKPGARDGGGGRGKRYIMSRWGIRGLETSAALAEAGLDYTVEVYVSEESEEGVTVLWQGGSSKSESCQEL